jgi:hypothetical protein
MFLLSTTLPFIFFSMVQGAFEVQHSKISGNFANAQFSSYDDCGGTDASISGADTTQRYGAQGKLDVAIQGLISGYYSKYDYCEGIEMYGYFELEDSGFTSSLRNVVSMSTEDVTWTYFSYCNYTLEEPCQEVEGPQVTIEATLTPIGDIYKDRYVSKSSGPNYSYRYRSSGLYRDAKVEGTVTVDGEVAALDDYTYGVVTKTKSGDMYITHS